MANHSAAPLLLRKGDRGKLQWLVRSTSVRAGLAQRARIVLLAADGDSNTEIAEKVGATRTMVIAWRGRYIEAGIEGLVARPAHFSTRLHVASKRGNPWLYLFHDYGPTP